ncbi:MAG: response regulator [Cyanobacteria bacterium P01_A01_bin.37]
MTRILIAEDERIIAWNIQEVLQLTGHDVVSSVSTAEEAIAVAEQKQPDLVIMDIRLSGELDGIAAAEKIYASHGIPSIYLTAHADDYTVERAMETSPFGYVLKPFKRNDLLLAIKVAVNRHRHEKASLKHQDKASVMLNHIDDGHLAEGIDYFLNAPAAPLNVPATEKSQDFSDRRPLSNPDDAAALLAKLTSAIRRSLDDKSIINNIIQDLGHQLNLRSCHVGIHPFRISDTPTVIATFCQGPLDLTHFSLSGHTKSAVFHQFEFQQPVEFCVAVPSGTKPHQGRQEQWLSALACPLLNQHGAVIGDIMVMRDIDHPLSPSEIACVSSVADQCVIALRQSLLYQVLQNEEQTNSEHKNRTPLSDRWVSALSHELRTPIANIKMASQMLELVLKSLGILDCSNESVREYLQILRYECQRETRLVDALVEANQDSATQVLTFNSIHLPNLIEDVVDPYRWQIKKKRQRMDIAHAGDILQIKTIPAVLKRVLSELLDYACRYAPLDEVIHLHTRDLASYEVTASALTVGNPRNVCLDNNYRVSNNGIGKDQKSGIDILIQHRNNHVSASDLVNGLKAYDEDLEYLPQSHNPIGLGLFLAKKQIDQLSGTLTIDDADECITFCLHLPNDPENIYNPEVAIATPGNGHKPKNLSE